MKANLTVGIYGILSLFLAACGMAGDIENGTWSRDASGPSSRVSAQDGRALFVAIYSGLGDEDVDIPPRELLASEDVNRDEALSVWNRIVDLVDEKESSFFAAFSSDMRSGDPYLVQAALIRGSELAEEVVPLAASGAVAKEPEVVQKCSVGVVACVTLAVAFHTAVGAVNYIGGANVAFVVNVWVWRYSVRWDSAESLQSQVQTEAFVHDLTTRLQES